jgi:PadR family transcriptional regulator PadR
MDRDRYGWRLLASNLCAQDWPPVRRYWSASSFSPKPALTSNRLGWFATLSTAVDAPSCGSASPCYTSLGNRGQVSKPTDLVQGTLDLLLLKIVALEPLHGWAIAQRLKQVSGDVLQVSEGSLYPALHKLEQEGWITSKWQIAETGRRAKFYTLSPAGRRALEREAANWERLSGAISRVVRLKEV